jgi:hypothetical protein
MPGIAWKRWSWVESGAIPLVAAAMRAAWVAPLAYLVLNNLFVYPQGIRYPAWLAAAVLLVASAVERALQDKRGGRLLAAACGLLVVAGTVFLLLGMDTSRPVPWLRGLLGSLCLLYTSPSPRDGLLSRMPSSA